jgi:hypothetical protein
MLTSKVGAYPNTAPTSYVVHLALTANIGGYQGQHTDLFVQSLSDKRK